MSTWDIRPEQKKIARRTSSGLDLQLIEEMAELTQALLKRRRYNGEGQPTDKGAREIQMNINEEIADVRLVLDEYVWWEDIEESTLNSIQDCKIERTLERLEIEGEEE